MSNVINLQKLCQKYTSAAIVIVIIVMELQNFPQPGLAGRRQPKRTGLNCWKGSRFGTGSTTAGDASISYCLAAQILQRWNEEKFGANIVAIDVSMSIAGLADY